MKKPRLLALIPALALVLGITPLLASSALAATDPVWETGNADKVGTLAFYDASGNVVTSGSTTARPFVKYLAASQVNTLDTKATMYFAAPDPNLPIGSWATFQSTGSTVYPVAGGPGAIGGITNRPIATGTSGDFNLSDFLGSVTLSGASGYANTVQLRVYTSRPGSFSTTYATADILISGSTWTQVYPAPATVTATTTTVTSSPAGPVTAGTSVTFTATVAPANTAGSVEFFDGAASLGAGTYTQGTGKATLTTAALSVAAHTIKAVFTPTDTTAFSGSQGTLSFTVNAPSVTATTTTVTSSPAGPVTAGTSVTFTATVAPANTAGSVEFFDGVTSLGAGTYTQATGKATLTTAALSVATHTIRAVFIPTNAAAFSGSQGTLTFIVNAPAATPTTTTVTSTPASPVTSGTSVTFTATVAPANTAGAVEFFDGATSLGTGTYTQATGKATLATSALTVASHTIKAVFTPTNSAAFTGSQGTVSFTVNAPTVTATTTTVTADPAGGAAPGASVTFTATVAPSGTAGSVEFFDGATSLGAGSYTAGTGVATLATSALTTLGDHAVKAVFTPTDMAAFSGSEGTLAYAITDSTIATATTVTADPEGSSAPGDSVAFTATVAPTGVAGSVEFFDGATSLGAGIYTAGTGEATLMTSSLTSFGVHPIKAVFTPTDTDAYAGSEGSVDHLVTNVVLAVTPASPATYGTAVTLTATVPAGLTGEVTFSDGATALGTDVAVDTVTGSASTTVTPGGGDHSFTATFAETSPTPQTSVSAAADYTVDPAATTLTLSGMPSSVAYGSGRKLTVKVSSTAGVPTGTVTIKEGTAVQGTGTLVAGSVTIVLKTTMSVRTHPLVITYGGSADFASSTASKSLKVVKATPTMKLAWSKNPITSSRYPKLKVSMSAKGVAVNGTITITYHGKVVGKGTLKDGKVTVTFKKHLAAKSTVYIFKVSYGGSVKVNAVSAKKSLKVKR